MRPQKRHDTNLNNVLAPRKYGLDLLTTRNSPSFKISIPYIVWLHYSMRVPYTALQFSPYRVSNTAGDISFQQAELEIWEGIVTSCQVWPDLHQVSLFKQPSSIPSHKHRVPQRRLPLPEAIAYSSRLWHTQTESDAIYCHPLSTSILLLRPP